MPSPAAKGTCAPRAGIPMRCLPGDVQGASKRPVPAVESATEGGRIHDSFTYVNFIGYEGHGFAESFGGYQKVEAEVANARGAASVNPARKVPVNPARKIEAEGRAPGATDVAQCPQLFSQRRMVTVSQVLAARIAMAHNVGGLTVLSAGTILEGPAANGS
jgi:acetyl-CoA C-acetyltransferase